MYVNLGSVQSTAEIETGLQATSAGLKVASEVASGLTAIPIVGTVVAGLEAIVSLFHIGQGCGQACITSAATEQIFEVAGWDVELAGLAGMINQAQAVAALQWLLAQGESTMTSLQSTDSKAKAGLTNLTNTIQAQIEAVQNGQAFSASDFGGDAGPSAVTSGTIPVSAPTTALDATTLESSIFVPSNAAGYEPNSTSQGASLALQAIADATNQVQTASTPASSGIVGDVESAFSGMSGSALDILPVLAIGGLFLLSGNGSPTKTNPRRKLRRKRVR